MKIAEIKGEQAIDVLADIMEPFSEIFGDEEVKAVYEEGTLAKALGVALKKHKREVIQILASVNLQTPEEYVKTIDLLTLPKEFMELIQDEALRGLFPSRGQETENTSFGSATENIGVEEN